MKRQANLHGIQNQQTQQNKKLSKNISFCSTSAPWQGNHLYVTLTQGSLTNTAFRKKVDWICNRWHTKSEKWHVFRTRQVLLEHEFGKKKKKKWKNVLVYKMQKRMKKKKKKGLHLISMVRFRHSINFK